MRSSRVSTNRLAVVGTAIVCVLVILASLLPVQVGISTGGMLSISLQQVSANPGWLTGWSYRKQVTITNASADYQTKILVGESSGATGEEVDCGGKCKSDFSDLRFTGSDGQTLLDYWIESITGTTPNQLATIWVQNDATPSTTGYMYYGKADASAVSNGDNTFILFDDFPGTSINTDKWTVIAGTPVVSGGYLVLTGTTGTRVLIEAKAGSLYNIAKHVIGYATAANQLDNRFSYMRKPADNNYRIDFYPLNADNSIQCMTTNAGTSTQSTVTMSDITQVHNYWWSWVSGTVKYYQDSTLKATHTTNIPTQTLVATFYEGSIAGKVFYVDTIYIRKFAATEPTFTFGSEETSVVVPTVTNAPDNYGFGILQVGASANTTISYFSINNTGNCAVDITIQGTNMTGGDDTWELSTDASIGENIYGLMAGLDDNDDLFDVVVNLTANSFITNLARAATQSWGLNLSMPDFLSGFDGNTMTGTITLIASAAS